MKDTFSVLAGGLLGAAAVFPELLGILEDVCVMAGHTEACDSPRRVAVIGSGPAGLAAASMIRRKGHQVDVFEAAPVVGFTFLNVPAQESSSDAPEAFAPASAEALEAAVTFLERSGIVFRTSCPKGQAELDVMLGEYDAVICACGKAAVLPTDAAGCVQGKLFAAGTCVKNQKVLSAVQAAESGRKTASSVCAMLAQ
ncbi:MAG: FAD-dependent oxidoreductase [Mailhella sp.]|nr:FAD-dependent oxidoreductase [Mailhella sp.]